MNYKLLESLCRENDYDLYPYRHSYENPKKPESSKTVKAGKVAAAGVGGLAAIGGVQGIMRRRSMRTHLNAALRKSTGNDSAVSRISHRISRLPGYGRALISGALKPLTSVKGLKDTLYRASGLSHIDKRY